MNRIPRRALGLGVVAAALTLAGVAAPAAAQPEEQDCVLWIDEDILVCVPHGEDLAAAFTDQTGMVRVPSPDEGDSGGSEAEGFGASTVYDLVTYYANASYGGANFTITRSTACNGVTLSSVPNLGSYGLNDAVSSFFGWGSCTARLYADTSYGGSTYGYAALASSLGSFDNVASSTRAR